MALRRNWLSALLLALPTAAYALTFEVQPHVFCPVAATPCGYGSEAEISAVLSANFAEASLEFTPLKVSFQMLPPNFEYGTMFDGITGPAGDSAIDGVTNEELGKILVDTIAAADKTRMHIFLIPGMSICWASNPPESGNTDLTLVCSPYPGWGGVFAHEIGHYFCLRHTHGWQDLQNTSPLEPDHDGDDEFPPGEGITDTSRDAGQVEGYDPKKAAPKKADDGNFDANGKLLTDFDKNGAGVPLHTYCQPVVHPADASDPKKPDNYQPRTFFCEGTCLSSDAAGAYTDDPSYAPIWANAMSYYACNGPIVVNGGRTEAFTPDQIDLMARCINEIAPHRALLVDVCGSKGGDFDNDGICNADDACPTIWNSSLTDSDGDGIPGDCDNCPTDPNADQGNVDGDHNGDVCDTDVDGDGCVNKSAGNPFVEVNDDDIYSAWQVAGSWISATCNPRTGVEYSFTGNDTDGDGMPDCEDDDDDNDTVVDTSDPCPVVGGAVCIYSTDCGGDVPFWQVCQGGPCNLYFGRMATVSNPDPTAMLFDRIEIWNQQLFLHPPSGLAPSETALAIAGASSGLRGEGRVPRTIEIVNRETGEVAATLSFASDEVTVGDLLHGRWIEVSPPEEGMSAPTAVSVVWTAGASDAAAFGDKDDDGVPDSYDDCPAVADGGQIDTDRDSIGNACDADIDGDGRVTKTDITMVARCNRYVGPRQGPADYCGVESDGRNPLTDGRRLEQRKRKTLKLQRRAIAQRHCGAADLDGDARVGRNDLAIARTLLGSEVR